MLLLLIVVWLKVNNKTPVRSAFHSPEVSNKGNSPVRRTITHLITRRPDDFRQINLARKKRKEPDNQSINELFVLFESDNCRDDWIRIIAVRYY